MKKHMTTILLFFILAVGAGLLLYPSLSNMWNERHQSKAIATYFETVKDTDKEKVDEIMAAAEDFNNRINSKSGAFFLTEEEKKEYNKVLNITNTGIMAYIEIPSIDVSLPVYHGVSDAVLQVAVGHLEWSSLPIGGKGTHSVLSGHRGLPSAKLFTHLDQLEKGDVFTITVLDKLYTYEVDKITIVRPDEVDSLAIVPGEDYCTLVTCTPYGINTHRLFVRGTRIENERPPLYITTEAYRIDSLLATPVVAAPILVVLFIALMVKYRKPKGAKPEVEEIAYEEIEDE